MNKSLTISIIGAGNMGAAILAGSHRKFNVCVCEQDRKKVSALKKKYKFKTSGLEQAIKQSKIIILAVKPQNFDELLEQASRCVTSDQLVVSIAAGITTQYIEKRLGKKVRVVRTMPNLPAQVGEGMTGICKGKNSSTSDLNKVSKIFNQIGKTVIIAEKEIDAITALSGSGPAYLFLVVECLERAAKKLGLDAKLSGTLVRQTLTGSLKLLNQSKD